MYTTRANSHETRETSIKPKEVFTLRICCVCQCHEANKKHCQCFYSVLDCFLTTHCCFGLIVPFSRLLCWSAFPLVMLPGHGHLCMCCTHSIKVGGDMQRVALQTANTQETCCATFSRLLARLCTGGPSSPDANNDHLATAGLQHLPCTDMLWFKHENRSNTPVIPSLGTVRACPGAVDSAPHLHHSRVQRW